MSARDEQEWALQLVEEELDTIVNQPPARADRSEPARVRDYLYLGDASDADSLGLLQELGITHVLNCAGAGQRVSPYHGPLIKIVYKEICAKDSLSYNIIQHVPEMADFVRDAHVLGGKVLVHCNQGVNRSAALCLAFLLLESDWSILEAARYLTGKRDHILTNVQFRKQLVAFASSLKKIY